MTKIKNICFFLSMLIVTMAISCNNDDLKDCKADPDCEYFRCKVNGEEWSTNCERDPLFDCSAIDAQYYKNIPDFEVFSLNSEINETIRIRIRGSKIKIGINKLYFDSSIPTKLTNGNKSEQCREFPIDTSSENNIELIVLDTINFKVEGRFSFSAKNKCNENIKITDGLFRVKYRF